MSPDIPAPPAISAAAFQTGSRAEPTGAWRPCGVNKGFFLVQSEACCDWTTRDQNVLIKGRSIFFLIVGVNIATVCVTTLTAWRQKVAAEPNTFPKRSSTGSTEVGTYLLTHICCQGKSTRFSCNKRSPFNPLRHCGSPVASLFDCSENLQAISITLLLAEVPGAGRGGGGGKGKVPGDEGRGNHSE